MVPVRDRGSDRTDQKGACRLTKKTCSETQSGRQERPSEHSSHVLSSLKRLSCIATECGGGQKMEEEFLAFEVRSARIALRASEERSFQGEEPRCDEEVEGLHSRGVEWPHAKANATKISWRYTEKIKGTD